MKFTTTRRIAYLILAAAVFVAAALQAQRGARVLEDPAILTGYYLLGLMIFLALFNARKKLSMVPLGRAAVWLRVHVAGGLLAVALFWLHTRTLWPSGVYEQVLALVFYFVSLTGIVGHVLQRTYPSRLTQSGIEVIYERIPAELATIREEVESLVLECTEETGSDTIARHYLETFRWFFSRPRYIWSHAIGSRKGAHWVRNEVTNLRRYLNDTEQTYVDRLAEFAFTKNRIDYHYAAQSIMKMWLLVHLPLAVAVLALAIWHAILVHVYAL